MGKENEETLSKEQKLKIKKAQLKKIKKQRNKENKKQDKELQSEENREKQKQARIEQLKALEALQPQINLNAVVESQNQDDDDEDIHEIVEDDDEEQQQNGKIEEEQQQQNGQNNENNNNEISTWQEQQQLKKKQLKEAQQLQNNQNGENEEQNDEENKEDDSHIDYNILTGAYYEQFKDVFFNFDNLANRMLSKTIEEDEVFQAQQNALQQAEKQAAAAQSDQEAELQKQEQRKLEKQKKLEQKSVVSRKQRKQNRWQKVAELKNYVRRPELVEAWDITAPDPMLLVQIKTLRNTVGVPEHWSQKRKYLQNKRGFLKEHFQLPPNIEATGISKLRDPFSERDGIQMVKEKLRNRMNPKLGKIDIDYEVLHDAFFKNATKGKMTQHGDMYFEGKEEEIMASKYKPGKISEELREALGIQDLTPPPWLINMHRYGPPPAFPHLRLVGIQTEGEQQQQNDPNQQNQDPSFVSKEQTDADASKNMKEPGVYAQFRQEEADEDDQQIDKGFWGGLIDDFEEEEEEMGSDQDDSDIGQPDFQSEVEKQIQLQETQEKQQQNNNEQQTKSGITSVLDGLETPEVDLRNIHGKREDQFKYSQQDQQQQPSLQSNLPLFQILEPTSKGTGQGGIFQTGNSYVMPGQKK